MPDYNTQQMTLGGLVKLTAEFLKAAEMRMTENGRKDELRKHMTPAQNERMHELYDEWNELNQEIAKVISVGTDHYKIDQITNSMNAVSLEIHDILLGHAERVLGKPYMMFMAPDALRTESAIELLTLNKAHTISSLTKNTLQ